MNKVTLILPTLLVLEVVYSLGKQMPAFTAGGEQVVVAFLICFGMWLAGYVSGINEEK